MRFSFNSVVSSIFLRNTSRGTTNLTSVTDYVKQLRSRTNLLLYYTADEPDGSEAPLSAPASSTAYINSLDPYRPSSLVLNCQDYFFSDYAAGTPILMPDPYPIGINATYSVVWNTTCTRDQGDCGCDNCVGDFEDIRSRIHEYATRLEVLGWERSKSIWIVPQAFGGPGSRCVEFVHSVSLQAQTGESIFNLLLSCLQVLVAYPYGRGVHGGNDRGHQRGGAGLRGLE